MMPQKSWVWESEGVSEKMQVKPPPASDLIRYCVYHVCLYLSKVCRRFLRKKCQLTTCPFAHPGLRDQSIIYSKRYVILSLWKQGLFL